MQHTQASYEAKNIVLVAFYENDIHDKYSQGENGDFPYPPGLSQRRSCRYPDLDSASVGAEAGGPFREWAKVKLVGGTAPC
jgi:hypothetical protein